jgi:hypothetical protein
MLAFNTGWNGSIKNPGDGIVIAKVAVNTVVYVLASSMTAIVVQRFVFERSCWNFEVGLNCSFIGMVSIFLEKSVYRALHNLNSQLTDNNMRRMYPVSELDCSNCRISELLRLSYSTENNHICQK